MSTFIFELKIDNLDFIPMCQILIYTHPAFPVYWSTCNLEYIQQILYEVHVYHYKCLVQGFNIIIHVTFNKSKLLFNFNSFHNCAEGGGSSFNIFNYVTFRILFKVKKKSKLRVWLVHDLSSRAVLLWSGTASPFWLNLHHNLNYT